jgi:hypothetical protein
MGYHDPTAIYLLFAELVEINKKYEKNVNAIPVTGRGGV